MPRSAPAAAGLLALAGLLTAGCAAHSPAAAPAGTATVRIELTTDGCVPSPASVPAGPVTFTVTNAGTGSVTEAELVRDGVIVAEKENLTPGLSGSFSLRLAAGTYQIYCPGAKTEKTGFTVTGGGSGRPASQDPALAGALDQATTGYQRYVVGEVAKLVPATEQFTDAVRAGDVALAQSRYAEARYYYEEIEPVAESFGDLDPAIDARVGDVTDPSQWTGFHRIEKALWADGSLAGMAPIADRLDADVAQLQAKVATASYQPAQLANGATELLNEVAATKVTGEEEQYSHTDLVDFAANVAGAKQAYDLLQPALRRLDPQLAATVAQRFTDVLTALGRYRQGSGYVDYRTVSDDQRRVLTQKVDALAEPLSQVAAKVTQ